MLRFPYRQVFGEFDEDGAPLFYDLDRFVAHVSTNFVEWESNLTAIIEGDDG